MLVGWVALSDHAEFGATNLCPNHNMVIYVVGVCRGYLFFNYILEELKSITHSSSLSPWTSDSKSTTTYFNKNFFLCLSKLDFATLICHTSHSIWVFSWCLFSENFVPKVLVQQLQANLLLWTVFLWSLRVFAEAKSFLQLSQGIFLILCVWRWSQYNL